MKFDWKRIKKATLIGVASLALIIPLGISGSSSAHTVSANGADAYGDQAGEMIFNGLINKQGQWTASKWDHWLFNHRLMDSTGELDGMGDEVQDLSNIAGISFMHSYRLFESEGEPDFGPFIHDSLKKLHAHHHVSKRNHRAKRTRKARMNKRSRKRNKPTKRRNRKHSKRARKSTKRNRRNRKARKHIRRY